MDTKLLLYALRVFSLVSTWHQRRFLSNYFSMRKYRDPEISKAPITGFGISTIPGSRDPDPGIISSNQRRVSQYIYTALDHRHHVGDNYIYSVMSTAVTGFQIRER